MNAAIYRQKTRMNEGMEKETSENERGTGGWGAKWKLIKQQDRRLP
jgi:hypothetical protein